MSSGNALVDALEAVQAEVKRLGATIKAADPAKVAEQAERGASRAVAPLVEATRSLQSIAADLRQWAVPAAQMAQEAEERRRWWKWMLAALIAVLMLLSGFVAGMVYIRSGLAVTTEVGCRYLGGEISTDQRGRSFCSAWIN